MPFRNSTTGEYPVSHDQIRKAINSSFPAYFEEAEGYDWVVSPVPPTYDPETHERVEVEPALVDGVWTQQWEVRPLAQEVIDARVAAKQAALIREVTNATQARLDTFARTRNYDGILSACTYATSTVTKFQAEGQYCVNARDLTWATLYQIMGEVEAGTRPILAGFADIENDLPVLTWPDD